MHSDIKIAHVFIIIYFFCKFQLQYRTGTDLYSRTGLYII